MQIDHPWLILYNLANLTCFHSFQWFVTVYRYQSHFFFCSCEDANTSHILYTCIVMIYIQWKPFKSSPVCMTGPLHIHDGCRRLVYQDILFSCDGWVHAALTGAAPKYRVKTNCNYLCVHMGAAIFLWIGADGNHIRRNKPNDSVTV